MQNPLLGFGHWLATRIGASLQRDMLIASVTHIVAADPTDFRSGKMALYHCM